MPASRKRKSIAHDTDGPPPKRKTKRTAVNTTIESDPTVESTQETEVDLLPAASQEYAARGILQESKTKYLIDWEGTDPRTGNPYQPDWQPKSFANTALVIEWKEKKAKDTEEAARRKNKKLKIVLNLSSPEKSQDSTPIAAQDSLSPGPAETPASTLPQPRNRRKNRRVVDSSAASNRFGERNTAQPPSISSAEETGVRTGSPTSTRSLHPTRTEAPQTPLFVSGIRGVVLPALPNFDPNVYATGVNTTPISQQQSGLLEDIFTQELPQNDSPLQSRSQPLPINFTGSRRVIPDSQDVDTSISISNNGNERPPFTSSAPLPSLPQLGEEEPSRPEVEQPLIEDRLVQSSNPVSTQDPDVSQDSTLEELTGLSNILHTNTEGALETVAASQHIITKSQTTGQSADISDILPTTTQAVSEPIDRADSVLLDSTRVEQEKDLSDTSLIATQDSEGAKSSDPSLAVLDDSVLIKGTIEDLITEKEVVVSASQIREEQVLETLLEGPDITASISEPTTDIDQDNQQEGLIVDHRETTSRGSDNSDQTSEARAVHFEDAVEHLSQESVEIIEIEESSAPEVPTNSVSQDDERVYGTIPVTPQRGIDDIQIEVVGHTAPPTTSSVHFETQVPFELSQLPDSSSIQEEGSNPQTIEVDGQIEVQGPRSETFAAPEGQSLSLAASPFEEPESFQKPLPIEGISEAPDTPYVSRAECPAPEATLESSALQSQEPFQSTQDSLEIIIPAPPAKLSDRVPPESQQVTSAQTINTLSQLDSFLSFPTISSGLPPSLSQILDKTLDSQAPPFNSTAPARPQPPSTMSDWIERSSPLAARVMHKKPTFSELKSKRTAELEALRKAEFAQLSEIGSVPGIMMPISRGSPAQLNHVARHVNHNMENDETNEERTEAPIRQYIKGDDPYVFSLPIQLFGPAGLLYRNQFHRRKELINNFLDHSLVSQNDDELVGKVEQLLQTAFDLTTHSDLLSDNTWTQQETVPEDQAKWDFTNSSKFAFLRSFFQDPRVCALDKHVVIFARPGKLIDMVETFLQGIHISYERPGKHPFSGGHGGSLEVTLLPTGSSEHTDETVTHPADLVLAIDETFSANEDVVRQVRKSGLDGEIRCPVVLPVTVYTLEHIARVVNPVGTRLVKFRELLGRSKQLLVNAGRAPVSVPKPDELGRLVADCFSSILDWEHLPSLTNIDLPKFEDGQPSSSNSLSSLESQLRKRPVDVDSSSSGSFIAKRARWAFDSVADLNNSQSQGFGAPTSSTLSEPSSAVNKLLQEALDRERGLREENAKLKEIAASSQILLETVTERNELQSRELVLARAQVITADTARTTAEARCLTLNTTITELKEERKTMLGELDNTRGLLGGSIVPTVAELGNARTQISRAEDLQKRLANLTEDHEFMRGQYQTASNFARELGVEKDILQAENTKLQTQASGEAAKLRQMFVDTSVRLAHEEMEKLKRKEATNTKVMAKLIAENTALKVRPGMTMTTRASSVPRRAGGGGSRAGSRQGSPLPSAAGASRAEKEKVQGKSSHLRE